MGFSIPDHENTALESGSPLQATGVIPGPDGTASEVSAEGTSAATTQNQESETAETSRPEFNSDSGSSRHNGSPAEDHGLGNNECFIQCRDQGCTDLELGLIRAAAPVKPEFKDGEKRLESLEMRSLSSQTAKTFANGGFYALGFDYAFILQCFYCGMIVRLFRPSWVRSQDTQSGRSQDVDLHGDASQIPLPLLKEHKNDCCFHHVVSQGFKDYANQIVCQRCQRHLPCTRLLYLFCGHICCVCLECALYSPPCCSEGAAALQSLANDGRTATSPQSTVGQNKDKPACSGGHNLSSPDSIQPPLARDLHGSAAAVVEQRGISCAQCGRPAQYIKGVKYTD